MAYHVSVSKTNTIAIARTCLQNQIKSRVKQVTFVGWF